MITPSVQNSTICNLAPMINDRQSAFHQKKIGCCESRWQRIEQQLESIMQEIELSRMERSVFSPTPASENRDQKYQALKEIDQKCEAIRKKTRVVHHAASVLLPAQANHAKMSTLEKTLSTILTICLSLSNKIHSFIQQRSITPLKTSTIKVLVDADISISDAYDLLEKQNEILEKQLENIYNVSLRDRFCVVIVPSYQKTIANRNIDGSDLEVLGKRVRI
jgi:hypothetical protein